MESSLFELLESFFRKARESTCKSMARSIHFSVCDKRRQLTRSTQKLPDARAGGSCKTLIDNCIGICLSSPRLMIKRVFEGLACFLARRLASDKCDQAIKGVRWMSRRDEAMKDVEGCEIPRGVVKQALILGCPNGETRRHCESRWRHWQLNV